MGTGISGNYSYLKTNSSTVYSNTSNGNIKEGSQPYADLYSVLEEAIISDIHDGVYLKDLGYRQNPTATTLKEDDMHIVSSTFTGYVTYVINEDSKIIFGRRNGAKDFRTPHPSLIGGKDPKVKMAGMIIVKKGKIVSINNNSGHYRPNIQSLDMAKTVFNELGDQLFWKGKLK